MQRLLSLILIMLAGPVTTLAPERAGAAEARTVTRAVEVPAVWAADQHLYLKGNLNLPPDRLGELEAWLDVNAPHWTVVLSENAEGESFTDAEGKFFTGMDAVEHALGKRLAAETEFGKFTHPVTGERSGAFFVMFLRERKFSYYGSDAYDRRGLGEDDFTGNLDGAAIRAMRGGGRIADAVKDTITFIDGELARRLAGEAEAKQRAAETARRFREETAAMTGRVRSRLTELQGRIAEMKRDLPQAGGTLLKPPADQWSAATDAAAADLAAGRTNEAAATLRSTDAAVEGHFRALIDHAQAPAKLTALEQEADALRLHEYSAAAQDALMESRTFLKAATDLHKDADAGWQAQLTAAAEQLHKARGLDGQTRRDAAELERLTSKAAALKLPEGSDAAARRQAAAEAALEKTRSSLAGGGQVTALLAEASRMLTEAEEAAAEWTRDEQVRTRALQTGGSVTGGLALLAGWWGNRRRRRVREKAQSLFHAWEKTLGEKTGGLFQLLDRTGTSIGTSQMLERSGWTGETERLSRQVIRDVDQLFVMSSALDAVLEKARVLIFPANPLGGAVNFVAGGRYEKAVRLLAEDKIQFAPDDPLRPVLQPAAAGDGKTSEWRGLLGRKEDCEAFSLTFDELNGAFNEHARRAVDALDKIDGSWLKIEEARRGLDTVLDAVEAEEQKLHAAAAADGLFAPEALFDKLLPAAREDQEAGDRMAAKDPVQALEKPLAEGARKAADARALCDAASFARAALLPALEVSCAALRGAGRRTAWVDEALDALSDTGAELGAKAAERDCSGEIAALAGNMEALRTRTAAAADLTKRADEQCLPDIVTTEKLVSSERASLGAALGLPGDRLLCETEAGNPSVRLAAARDQHAAALAALDRGDVPAAEAALRAGDELRTAAEGLVEETRKAFSAHSERSRRAAAETSRIAGVIAPQSALLTQLQQDWAPSALMTTTAPGETPGTVADNIREAETALTEARRLADSAAEQYRAGRLLSASDDHAGAEEAGIYAERLLKEITAHAEKLRATAAANRTLAAELESARALLQPAVDQPAAMRRTADLMTHITAALREAAAAASAKGSAANPFTAAAALADCQEKLKRAEEQLQADLRLHEDAVLSVQEAAKQLRAVEELASKAQTDSIPDSRGLAEAVEAIPALRSALSECATRLDLAHEDWPEVDAAADAVAAESARLRGIMSGELARAEEAVQAMRRAAEKVRQLHSAGGLPAALTDSSAGQHDLRQARDALARGDYSTASSAADQAARAAQQAIDTAEEAERRRRREAAQRAASFSARSSGSSFSGSSGRSSGSSSGGSSRSSSSSSGTSRSGSSSGSGTARSGW